LVSALSWEEKKDNEREWITRGELVEKINNPMVELVWEGPGKVKVQKRIAEVERTIRKKGGVAKVNTENTDRKVGQLRSVFAPKKINPKENPLMVCSSTFEGSRKNKTRGREDQVITQDNRDTT